MATFTAVAGGGNWQTAATWDLNSSYPLMLLVLELI
jgi:hypothetical protein